MRVPQPEGRKGSLMWLQRAVATHPGLLQPASLPPIEWLSPRAEDGFAEYRDAAFLHLVGHGALAPALGAFWPRGGPQWDALGRAAGDAVILAEAKAHIGEFMTGGTTASPASRARIDNALARVKNALGAAPVSDWSHVFYQYANRLAHLWWLREQGVAAELVFVSFLGDTESHGPDHAETWQAAFAAADHALGLPARHGLSRHVHHLYPPVAGLAETA